VLHERQLVGTVHRAGNVDEEHEVASQIFLLDDLAALQADQRESVLRVPRAL
jgi:hypothetical protein